MRISRLLTTLFATTSLLLGAKVDSLLAAPTPTAPKKASPELCREFVVQEPEDTCVLYLHHTSPIGVRLKSAILETEEPEEWKVKAKVRPSGDTVMFRVKSSVKARDIAGVYIVWTRLYTLHIIVRAAKSEDEADDAIVLRHKSWVSRFNAAVQAKAQEQCEKKQADRDAEHNREIATLREQIAEEADRELMREMVRGHDTTPIYQPPTQGESFSISGLDWVSFGERRTLRFAIDNPDDDQLPVTRVQLFNAKGTRDHAGVVQIGESPDASDGPLGVVEGHQRVVAAVMVKAPDSLGNFAKLVVHGPKGTAPQIRVIPIQPPEKPPLTAEQKRDRQVILGVRLVGGGCWLPGDIPDGKGGEATKATPCGGAAIHVTKGLSKRWAVEVEAVGTATGEASFEASPSTT